MLIDRMSSAGSRIVLAVAACAYPLCSLAQAQLQFTGINLAGAEFGEHTLPGNHGQHYNYPNAAEVNYFLDKGMNVFRLPFRWERLQRTLNGDFDETEFGRLDAFVTAATSAGGYVVLDPHNYARYRIGGTEHVIGSGTVPHAAFGDFWARLSDKYKHNDRVIFGLMNDPNSMPTEQWLTAANTAIAAIRNTGANNLILVPGNGWSGAHSWTQNWYGTPNGTVMLNVVDPANNFAFDAHQYLDSDSSGTTSNIVSATIGQERLVTFTNWLRANNRRGFLGEFAVANSTIGIGANQIGDEAMTNMLSYIADNDDVWLGWTWWAAGPWWNEYRFTMEPTNLGQPNQADRPTMGVVEPFLVAKAPELSGDFNRDGVVDAADYTVWRNVLGQQVDRWVGADGDGNGVIDADDYQVWKQHYGEQAAGSAGLTISTPEPSSHLLAIGIFAAFASQFRRRP